LRQELEAFEPDVIHLAAPAVLGMMTVRIARRMNIPIVAVYQTDYAGFALRYRARGIAPIVWRLLRTMHWQVDLTLAPSTSAVWQLQHHGIERVALWGRGVNLNRFHPHHRSELLHRRLADRGEVIVGYVGRLAREKRVELLKHAQVPNAKRRPASRDCSLRFGSTAAVTWTAACLIPFRFSARSTSTRSASTCSVKRRTSTPRRTA
jgi:phosphatidylinositol alpha 1,6-mannosyltransferase